MDTGPIRGSNDERDPRPRDEATASLRAAAAGDAAQRERLFELVYQELRRLAARYLADERTNHTLQPTALVHEAFLKLIDRESHGWEDKQHFFLTAAGAMRCYLVDHARGKKRMKRGGGWQRVDLDAAQALAEQLPMDLIELDGALDRLRGFSERQARIVELRFFAGLPVEEVAQVLGVSESTVAREWHFARTWLTKELEAR